jgi:RecJ-like exonuclease
MENRIDNRDRFRGKSIQEKRPQKSKIADLKDGDFFSGDVKILRKAKPGPTILLVTDGYASIDVVADDNAPDADSMIKLTGKVNERNGKLQIEAKFLERSNADFSKIIDEAATPLRTEFSISSERYSKMKQRFIDIAKRIRKAIIDNQPIIIRHHNDSDGINSGLALQIACANYMVRKGIDPSYNLHRSPSKAPFYEASDAFRDIVYAKRLIEEFKQKKPLLVMLDNGSTPEDIFGLEAWNSVGYEAIVIDHHNPVILENGKTAVCKYLSLHLNPYMFGLDSETSAGMLCYEVARMIDEEFEMKAMPAVAAISDRSKIAEAESYIKNSGIAREYLTKIGVAIDFIAYHMKFDPGKGLIEELYHNKALVEQINKEVTKGVETQLQSTLPYLRTQEINGVIYSYIDLEKYTMRFTYPTPGKVISMIHDHISKHSDLPTLTIGHLSDMVIVRANQPVLPVHTIMARLQKDMPNANVDGGGHEMAGTLKFVPAHLDAILQSIKQQVKEISIAE